MNIYTPEPQSIQMAINACNNAHTGLHQAIGELTHWFCYHAPSFSLPVK